MGEEWLYEVRIIHYIIVYLQPFSGWSVGKDHSQIEAVSPFTFLPTYRNGIKFLKEMFRTPFLSEVLNELSCSKKKKSQLLPSFLKKK